MPVTLNKAAQEMMDAGADLAIRAANALAGAQQLALEAELRNLAYANATEGLAFVTEVTGPVSVLAQMILGVRKDFMELAQEVADKNTKTGFSQAAVMGLLGWKWHQVTNRFARRHVLELYQRQDLNDIRVISYNVGLILGYVWASTVLPPQRKIYLKVCKKISDASPGAWTERDQINYVIDMAVAFARTYMLLW